MDFMNTPEQFAHIPKDILRDRRMTLAAKGLYGKYQQTGSFSDWNCLFLFYKNPLYFQSGYAILGMYLGNYKYYAIQNIIVYKTKGANLYETDGR